MTRTERNAYKLKWALQNIDRVRAQKRESARRARAAAPEKMREATQRWREQHPEKARLSRNASMRRWAKLNPEEKRARDRHEHYRRKYGITTPDYEALLSKQSGVCAICSKPPGRIRLAVDHCHQTKKVRGLLCLRCNTTVGILEKRADVLPLAAAYLDKHK
jgi:hypothetical protein